MPPLDQGPHLPGETAERERGRDCDQGKRRGGEGMGGREREGLGKRGVEGCEGKCIQLILV